MLSHRRLGNSSVPIEKPLLLFLFAVLSPQLGVCDLSRLSARKGKPAIAHCLCVCSDRAALAVKTHLGAQQRHGHGSAQRWARSKAAWAFHIQFISQVTHFACTHQPPSANSYLIFMESTERSEVISKIIHLAWRWSFLSALKMLQISLLLLKMD